ncbi:complement C3 alpha chain-like [Amphiprion ocellaris]|uniref:complement C3 alpha chain-like n=1 Tax=Amphiprion ocellaris TaxID=80972 RepID=UPI00241104B6|nr:complement C3 alpha chain-like [Amphiprion ocellaris]
MSMQQTSQICLKCWYLQSRALGPRDVRMVVLDISLPTGFTPENSDLEMLSNSVHRYISNFQIVDNLSDRDSLIIHLFKVTSLYL